MKRNEEPDNPNIHFSHEIIYKHKTYVNLDKGSDAVFMWKFKMETYFCHPNKNNTAAHQMILGFF